MSFSSNEKTEAEKAAEAWGIDLSLIDVALERTPTERLLIHQSMLNTAIQLQEAMRNARIQGNPQPAKGSTSAT